MNTDSWYETRAALEGEQLLLLTDKADQIITSLIEQHERYDEQQRTRVAQYILLHRMLLRRARMVGIPRAWKRFEVEIQEQERVTNLTPSVSRDDISGRAFQEGLEAEARSRSRIYD